MPTNSQTPEKFLEQLPSAETLRNQIQRHREEGKVLRRLLKLASQHEAASRGKSTTREAAPC